MYYHVKLWHVEITIEDVVSQKSVHYCKN